MLERGMRHVAGPAVLALLTGTLVVLASLPVLPAPAAEPPVHTLDVSGEGVDTYPDFAGDVDRYGVTTTGATDGTLSVTASTEDPAGRVLVDGRVAPGGTATLSGLEEGDEVSVWIEDSAGTARHTLVYLPAGFPEIDVTVDGPAVTPGSVFLTLNHYAGQAPAFEAVVDRNGVPSFVRGASQPQDFKMLGNGHVTVHEATTTPGRTGATLIELDETFTEVRRTDTVGGLADTDGHDSITLPDGGHYLLSYDQKPDGGPTDAVIQQLDAEGAEVWRWDSGDFGPDHESLEDETVNDADFMQFTSDYAHINSIQLMEDGNLLASFRHLSAVLKIARHDSGDVQSGEVIWKLGGRDSSFDFVDGEGGPCAPHSASELPNGRILLYDNGSDGFYAPSMCLDPTDRSGPTISRPVTRVTEWELTMPEGGQPGTAVAAWDQEVAYGIFAGNAQRLETGNTMVGWGAPPHDVVAVELGPDGQVLWEMRVPYVNGGPRYTTYRALKFAMPDRTPPVVHVDAPVDGASFAEGEVVAVDFTCTDRGGSGLQTCGGSLQPGDLLDTSVPGRHSVDLVATDGDGQETVVRRTYVVRPTVQPDLLVRALPTGTWVGADTLAPPTTQRTRRTVRPDAPVVRSLVALQNDGLVSDRLVVRGTAGNGRFAVRYLDAGVDVTRAVLAGTYRTDLLAPGATSYVRIVVERRAGARVGDARTFTVSATSETRSSRRDAVGILVTARR